MELTRRDFLRLMSAVAAGAVLISCKPAATPAPPAEEKPAAKEKAEEKPAKPAKEIELVWMCRTSPEENPWEEEIVKPDFEAKHPNIKIKAMIIDQPDIGVKREAMIAAKQPLHVWSPNWGGDGFASDRCRGLLENLTPLVESSGFDNSDFIPYTWDCYEFEGKVYGVPQLTCGSYIYVNKDIFEEAGVDLPPTDWSDTSWTWDELARMAKKITHDYDDVSKAIYGIAAQTGGDPMTQLALPWGRDCLKKEAYETGFYEECYFDDPVVIKSFQFRHDLIWKDKVMPDQSINEALGELGGTFQSNKLAMQGTGGWGHWAYYGIWTKEKAGEQAFKWRACPIPYGDTAVEEGYEGPRAVIYTDPWSITAGLPEDEKEASWEFVEYLATKDAMWAYSKATGTPPVLQSLLEDYFDLYKGDMTHEEAKEGFMGPYKGYGFESSNHLLVRWEELNETWGNTMDPFWTGPEATAEEFLPKLDKIMEEAGKKIKEETTCKV